MCSLLSCRSHFIYTHNLSPLAAAKSIFPIPRVHSPESRPFSIKPLILTAAATGARRRSESSRSPMDRRSPEMEDFVRIENATAEDLSDSIVRVDQPKESDAEPTSVAAAEASPSEPDPKRRGNSLPDELSRSVVVLECESSADGGLCNVYLVGTAHVSVESCKEVEAVISYLKPEIVFLELCSSRAAVLSPQNLQVPTMGDMVEMWKKNHNLFGILYSWFLSKVANKLEVFPGSEFRVAYEEAMKYGGRVILGDRPVKVTLLRTWGKMPLWHKIKLLYSMFFQAVFLPSQEDLNKMLKEMDDVDMLTLVIQEMSKEFPTLMETLVHERDKYMSSMLLRIGCENSSVVAVVGKGHLQGIRNHWKQPVEIRDLMEIPSQKPADSSSRIFRSLGFAVASAAIISGIYLFRKK